MAKKQFKVESNVPIPPVRGSSGRPRGSSEFIRTLMGLEVGQCMTMGGIPHDELGSLQNAISSRIIHAIRLRNMSRKHCTRSTIEADGTCTLRIWRTE